MSCALSASQPKRSNNKQRAARIAAKSSKHAYVAQCASSTLSVIDKLKYVQSSKKCYVKSMFRAKRKNNIYVKKQNKYKPKCSHPISINNVYVLFCQRSTKKMSTADLFKSKIKSVLCEKNM